MRSSYRKLSEYIELVKDLNHQIQYDESCVRGVSNNKKIIKTKANNKGRNLSGFYIVAPNDFIYNSRTSRMGDKVGLGYNDSKKAFITSFNNTVFRIKNEKLLPTYLFMWFNRAEFDRYVRYHSWGSSTELFSWNNMCDVELPVPCIEKQRQIVSEYNAVNDRIALNEQLTQKLEEKAQAIYKQWFVEFEFPISNEYAESVGKPELEGKPYNSSGGEMVYCAEAEEELPKGWDNTTFSTCTSYLSRGLAPKYLDIGGCLVLNQKCVRNSSINFELARRHDFKNKKTIDERFLEINDVVVNSTGEGTLGRVAVVKYLPEKTIVDTHVTILRPNEELNAKYFWFSICMRESEIENLAEGSTGQTELKREYLCDFQLKRPKRDVQDEFEKLMLPLLKRLELIEKELPNLIELKNVCLQIIAKV